MRSIRSLIILTASMFIASSCFEDPGTDIIYEDASIEIQEATTASGVRVGKAYDRLNDGIAKKDSIRINLVGAHRSSAVNVSFAIDDSKTTAVAGLHYNLITPEGGVSIPANSSYGYVYYEILSDNIEPGENWDLKFDLTSADVELNPNFDSFTRVIRISCPFVRPNFLGAFNANEPGYGDYTVTFSEDATDATTIVADNFWDFGGVVKYKFNANGTVTLAPQDVVMGGVTYVVSAGTGAATYDACEQKFIVPYKVNRKSDNALLDNNTHTFTIIE